MIAGVPVPVVRRFSLVGPSSSDSDERQVEANRAFGSVATWEQLDQGYRSVIIAEAGAGKTFELKTRATQVEALGRSAFFIRICQRQKFALRCDTFSWS